MKWFLLIGAICSLQASEVKAWDLAHVSNSQVQNLKSLFSKANLPKTKDLQQKKSWQCQMYGVRTQMQVHKKPGLYNFKKMSLNSNKFENKGKHVFKIYQKKQKEVLAKIGPLRDRLRVTPKGLLVSELSKISTDKKSKPGSSKATVLAYTLCR